MITHTRFLVPKQGLVISLLLLGVFGGCVRPDKANAPMHIVAFSSAAGGEAWSIRVDPDGSARFALGPHAKGDSWVEIEKLPYVETSRLRVPDDQLEEFRRAVEEVDYYSLRAEQGHRVFDSSDRSLNVTIGERSHSITLRYMDWERDPPESLRQYAGAIRVFSIVRSWVEDERATDLAQYDKNILAAALAVEDE